MVETLTVEKVVTEKLLERVHEGKGRTIISPDLSSFVAELDLAEFSDADVRRAIRRLHRDSTINCGHPKREEVETPPNGPRGYKITLLIHP